MATPTPPTPTPVTVETGGDPAGWTTLRDGGVTSAAGFAAAATTAGLKASGTPDMAVILVTTAEPATAAAVLTQSVVRAAPVDLCAAHLTEAGGVARAVVVNSGQANACTGADGEADAAAMAAAVATAAACAPSQVLVASTGVIGKRVDMAKYEAAVPGLVGAATANGGATAARAILTTDLVEKTACVTGTIGGKTVTVGGMAKGSGMIHPNMATMLGFVTTDAAVEPAVWAAMVSAAADASFNAITVDGDTSTNDSLVGLASGAAGNVAITDGASADGQSLAAALTVVCVRLAKAIARDGEGATVLLEVSVTGASTDADARAVARAVAGSSLTKAAVYGRDPNWGRIAAAVGRAGVPFDQTRLGVSLGGVPLMVGGTPVPYDETAVSGYMAAAAASTAYLGQGGEDTVRLDVALGGGPGAGVAWGCDLTYKYVEINAEYTT